MRILTFDTSLNKMYVTLSINDKVIESEIIENTEEKYHSAYLIPTIAELLKRNELLMQDINAIGVNIGPGSFTGIRASVTVARVIGQQLNIPIIGLSSLEIISKINKSDKKTLVLMDARKNKAYTALYDKDSIIIEPQAYDIEKAIELAQGNEYFIIADAKMKEILVDNNINSTDFVTENAELGHFLAKLTYKYLNKNTTSNEWYKLKPLYIQPPPISMPKAKV